MRKVIWINIFVRDLLLILVIAYLQYATKFNSKTVYLITGMMIVYVTWQFHDLLNYRRLDSGL